MKNILFATFVLLISAFNLKAQTLPPFQWGISLDSTALSYGLTKPDKLGGYLQNIIFNGYTDIDPGSGVTNTTTRRNDPFANDQIIIKLDANRDLAWTLQLDTLANFGIYNFNQSTDYLLVGHFSGTVDFDPGPGKFNMNASNGGTFLSRLDANRNLIWAKQLDGSNGGAIIDQDDQIYLTGHFDTIGDFDPGPATFFFSNVSNLMFDANYVLKLDANANLIWGKHFEGTAALSDIEFGQEKDIYISGILDGSADLDSGPGFDYHAHNSAASFGGLGAYFVKLDSNGNHLWARSIRTTTGDNFDHQIVLDSLDNIYISGNFNDTVDFDPGPGVFQIVSGVPTNPGNGYLNEVYLAKWDLNGDHIWTKNMPLSSLGPGGQSQVVSLGIDENSNIYISGFTSNLADFDPGMGIDTLAGGYVTKYDNNGNYKWGFALPTAVEPMTHVISDDNLIVSGAVYLAPLDIDPGAGVFNIYPGINKYSSFAFQLSNTAVGINETYLKRKAVPLYPNPANSAIFIDTYDDIHHANCYNISGQKIKVRRSGKQLNIQHLAPGNYFLEVITAEGYYTGKFSKQ